MAGEAGIGDKKQEGLAPHVAHMTLSASSAAVVHNVNSVLAMVDAAIEADKVRGTCDCCRKGRETPLCSA